jgi:peptidoglycan/LPS O-acetylase OafA/YrhL
MIYRKEIDGIRAIAIILVIAYHTNFKIFQGGFIGVDIFFVISGYLITKIIIDELNEDKFKLYDFYERRARRILPALLVVMILTLVVAYYWMLPFDMVDMARSCLGALLFISNILFWRETGYFTTVAELKPMLHTWSLAVEEQYYILFPIFMALIWGKNNNIKKIIFIIFIALSFVLSIWGSIYKPIPNFYLLPTRIWEILIGGYIALTKISPKHLNGENEINKPVLHCNILSIVGVSMIAFSFANLNKTSKHPGLETIIPVLGVALLIAFGNGKTIVGKILSIKQFTYIGLISYSLYLWHVPIFSLTRYRIGREPNYIEYIVLIIITIIISHISYKYIEIKFRNKNIKVGLLKNYLLGLISLVLMIICSIYYTDGFKNKINKELNVAIYPEKTLEWKDCKLTPLTKSGALVGCEFGDSTSEKIAILYGDSHAQALYSSLDDKFKNESIKGIRVYVKGCPVIPGVIEVSQIEKGIELNKKCLEGQNELYKYIRENIQFIIISIRWTKQLYPINGKIESYGYDNGEGGREYLSYNEYVTINEEGKINDNEVGKRKAIIELLNQLNKLNKKIILIGPIPEVGWDLPKYNYIKYLNEGAIQKYISTSAMQYNARNEFILKIFQNEIDKLENIKYIEAENIYCNIEEKGRCSVQVEGMPLYYDSNHLSNLGAERLVINILIK